MIILFWNGKRVRVAGHIGGERDAFEARIGLRQVGDVRGSSCCPTVGDCCSDKVGCIILPGGAIVSSTLTSQHEFLLIALRGAKPAPRVLLAWQGVDCTAPNEHHQRHTASSARPSEMNTLVIVIIHSCMSQMSMLTSSTTLRGAHAVAALSIARRSWVVAGQKCGNGFNGCRRG